MMTHAAERCVMFFGAVAAASFVVLKLCEIRTKERCFRLGTEAAVVIARSVHATAHLLTRNDPGPLAETIARASTTVLPYVNTD